MTHHGARTIGFVGLGNLGLPIAAAAAGAGLDVIGYDVRADRVRAATRNGVAGARQPEEVASCDLVALAVLDDVQVRDVVDQLLPRLRAGSLVVVHSTVLPDTVRTLGDQAAAAGVGLLDVPVSGGDVAAREGRLTLMVGGEDRWAEVASPYFDAVGAKVCRLGPLGAGAAAKLASQLMTFVNQLAALEAMKLARHYGIDESQVVDVASASTSDSWIIRNWGFFDRIYAAYEASGTPPRYRPWSKDLWDVVAVARQADLSLPLVGLAAQLSTPMFAERGTASS